MTQNAPVTLHAIVDRIKTQKTILLPAFAISAFALVGYAAADRQAPVIRSNKIVVPYGTYLNASDFEITDNRDNLDIMDVSIKSGTYEAKQLGTYRVTVTVLIHSRIQLIKKLKYRLLIMKLLLLLHVLKVDILLM